MATPRDRVRSRLGSWRGRGDNTLHARAKPEKVEITESYSATQEISKNPSMDVDGPGIGQIEVKIPYDGCDYFTRQAVDDVKRGIDLHPGAGERKANIGYLLLTDHAKTDLRSIVQRHNQVGVIPLDIAVTSADG